MGSIIHIGRRFQKKKARIGGLSRAAPPPGGTLKRTSY
jgi:hypothetical protein